MEPWLLACLTVAVCALCSLPFWTGPWLGMIDYPNHLSRYFILASHPQDSLLAAYYQVQWRPIPNIGLDTLVLAFHRITGHPTQYVSLVVTGVSAVLLVPAAMLLNRALFGAWYYWPLTSSLFVFNYVLLYGFTNYIAGLTLSVFFSALWLLARSRPAIVLLLVFAPAATLLFFVHLYAFALYGVFVACAEMHSLIVARRDRLALIAERVLLAAQFLPAALLMLLFSPTAGNLGAGRIRLSSVRDKLVALYSVLDIGIWQVSAASFLVLGVVVLSGLASRRLVFAPIGVIVLVALTIVFLAMPFTLLGSGFADFRMPLAIAAYAVASTRWKPLPRRAGTIMAGALGLLLLLRVGAMTVEWAEANRRYAGIMHAMEVMEPGRKLLTLIAAEDVTGAFLRRPPIDHAASLAVIARQAFVPSTFAEPEKQPIRFTQEVEELGGFRSGFPRLYDPARDQLALEAVAAFDYVLVLARMPLRRAVPSHLLRVDDGTVPDLALFAVRR